MNKKGQLTLGGIVILIIVIITAIALLQGIFSSQGQLTTKTNTVNETIDISANRKTVDTKGSINTSYWHTLSNGCPQTNGNWRLTDTGECALSDVVVIFSNGSSVLTPDTDYVINTTGGVGFDNCAAGRLYGDISFKNTSKVFYSTNVTKISYTFCQDGYSTNSATRTMAGLIGLLAVIALALFVVYYGLKEWI